MLFPWLPATTPYFLALRDTSRSRPEQISQECTRSPPPSPPMPARRPTSLLSPRNLSPRLFSMAFRDTDNSFYPIPSRAHPTSDKKSTRLFPTIITSGVIGMDCSAVGEISVSVSFKNCHSIPLAHRKRPRRHRICDRFEKASLIKHTVAFAGQDRLDSGSG